MNEKTYNLSELTAKEFCELHGHRWSNWNSNNPNYYERFCHRCDKKSYKEMTLLHNFLEIVKFPFGW